MKPLIKATDTMGGVSRYYELGVTRICEVKGKSRYALVLPYSATRSAIRTALSSKKNLMIRYKIGENGNHFGIVTKFDGYIGYITIGCQKFEGENAVTLRRWAKRKLAPRKKK